GGSEEAERGGNDGVSGLYPGGDESQPESFGSRRATDRASGSRKRGNFVLQRLDLRAEDEALRIADTGDGGQDLLANGLVLAAQVEKRNGRAGILQGRFLRKFLRRCGERAHTINFSRPSRCAM